MAMDVFRGEVAIVTGAGRGIGRSIALALARNGVCVALAARTKRQLKAVQAAIAAENGVAESFVCDIGEESQVVAFVKHTVKRFGRLDILINNAGIGIYGQLSKMTGSQWDQIMAINARGTFLMCREAIPHLRKQNRSFIINIGSVVSVKGYVNQGAYGASKHALLGMSKALAKEVQELGIRVHVICPGAVDTELVTKSRPDLNRARLIHPDEIADIVLFLASRRGNAVIDQIDVRRESGAPWA